VLACKGQKSASPRRIWRLTPTQYKNTLRAVLGTTPSLAVPLKPTKSAARYANYAEAAGLDALTAESVLDAGETVARQAAAQLARTAPCLAGAAPDAACVESAVGAFGRLAFRRPLTAEETKRYAGVALGRQAALGAPSAFELALEVMLASPHFLFRMELGDGKPDGTGRTRLGAFEVASALGYTLLDAPPDAVLLEAAQQNALATPDQIRAHVVRLVGDPAQRESVLGFFREYLDYGAAPDVFKDPKLYPWHKAPLLVADTDALLKDTLAAKGDILRGLLTTPKIFASAATAPSYGVMTASKTPVRMDAPTGQRAGFLTQPSFLAAASQADDNDPIVRGKFVREHLLCGVIPPIPPNVVQEPPELPNATLRERLQLHVKDPNCAACHSLMDPLGFAFEIYDHTGRYRTTEKNKPVDASGVLAGSGTQDGPFSGAGELMARLAGSPKVAECLVREAFRYLMGRDETDGDACALEQAAASFGKSGHDTIELMAGVLASDAFLYRTP
jgi:hypothetical protein